MTDEVRIGTETFRLRPGDQQLPVPNNGPSMHDLVIAELDGYPARSDPERAAIRDLLAERKRLGLERYGSLLQAHNGRDARRDLLEELADAAVEAHRARADHQQRRAAEAEEELARFAAHVSRYAELAEQAAGGRQAAAAAEEQRHVNEVISAHKDWIEAELDKADAKLAAAVAAERERIRQLAIRNHAVCTGDDGTSCFFADLITEPSGG